MLAAFIFHITSGVVSTVEMQLFHISIGGGIRFPRVTRRRSCGRSERALHRSRGPDAGATLLPAAAALLLVLLLACMGARFQPLLGVR